MIYGGAPCLHMVHLAAILRKCVAGTMGHHNPGECVGVRVFGLVTLYVHVCFFVGFSMFCDVTVAHLFGVLVLGILTRSFHTHTQAIMMGDARRSSMAVVCVSVVALAPLCTFNK